MASAPDVAVQKLTGAQREQVVRHLLRLPANDRRLRFGAPMRDSSIEAYAAGIDFARGALKEAIQDQFALLDSMLKQQYAWFARPRSLEQA